MPDDLDITIEVTIETPVEKVFNAWIDPELLTSWLTRQARVEPHRGGAYELFWEPENPGRNSTQGCRIQDFRRNQSISFNWKGSDEYAEIMGAATVVTITLQKVEEGTLLRFSHRGWGAGKAWEKARAWQAEAWRSAIENLKNLLENTDRFTQNISMN